MVKEIPRLPRIEVIGIPGIPRVKPGDNLAKLIFEAAKRAKIDFLDADILVVAQTVVSKAEGAVVRLSAVKPSVEAKIIAEKASKDPRLVEVILSHSKRVVRFRNSILITETPHGLICANSAVDVSNVSGGSMAAYLPPDLDRCAKKIQSRISRLAGKRLAVIISDTFGRPFRVGQVNVAVGVAGLAPLHNRRGERDLFRYRLKVKEIAVADEIASAAELVMGQAAEGVPAAVVRGYRYTSSKDSGASALVLSKEKDLFL